MIKRSVITGSPIRMKNLTTHHLSASRLARTVLASERGAASITTVCTVAVGRRGATATKTITTTTATPRPPPSRGTSHPTREKWKSPFRMSERVTFAVVSESALPVEGEDRLIMMKRWRMHSWLYLNLSSSLVKRESRCERKFKKRANYWWF